MTDCKGCPVQQGTHKPAEAVHGIGGPSEALRIAETLESVTEMECMYPPEAKRIAKAIHAQHARIAELEAELAALKAAPAAQAVDEVPESVMDAVADALGDAYDCGRAWGAWWVGTMRADDFSPVADDSDRVAEIARAAITADRALRATPQAPAESQRLAQFLLNMQTRLGSCREACGDEASMKAWDYYSLAAAALAAPQAQDVQRDALTQAAREVLAAVEKLPRYTYGYKNDGESRHLSSYESPDGRFLDRAKVIAAIAASAKGGAL